MLCEMHDVARQGGHGQIPASVERDGRSRS